jgi:hypothetical protein
MLPLYLHSGKTNVLKSGGVNHMSRSETGQRGAQLVADELTARDYRTLIMPPNNRGFDIQCVSPKGESFRVEVKCSSSIGTQVPLQINLDKIVRAIISSARLDGYKGSLKVTTTAKKSEVARTETKPKATAKR